MECWGTTADVETLGLQEQFYQSGFLNKCEEFAYFLVGKGPVLSRFRIRMSVLKQHPTTLVALLAGADAVRTSSRVRTCRLCIPGHDRGRSGSNTTWFMIQRLNYTVWRSREAECYGERACIHTD